jgi:putative glutamine amidotransferase
MLAVCRGLQLANVALGGTLIQDLPSERPSPTNHARSDARAERTHVVRVTPGSMLATALGATELTVNSSHHQAIGQLARGLASPGLAPDGVGEGAEWIEDDGWWMLGVQWHPEELVQSAEPWDRALLAAFRTAISANAVAR